MRRNSGLYVIHARERVKSFLAWFHQQFPTAQLCGAFCYVFCVHLVTFGMMCPVCNARVLQVRIRGCLLLIVRGIHTEKMHTTARVRIIDNMCLHAPCVRTRKHVCVHANTWTFIGGAQLLALIFTF